MMPARASLSTICAVTLLWWPVSAHAVEVTPEPPAVKLPGPAWVGFAVSPTGRVFSERSAEEDRARVFARHECERATGATCRVIAVPKSWKVLAILCGNAAFIAGVGAGAGSALPLARQKAVLAGVRGLCRPVFAR